MSFTVHSKILLNPKISEKVKYLKVNFSSYFTCSFPFMITKREKKSLT